PNFIFKYPNRKERRCQIQGCDRVVFATELCANHYHSKRKFGDPFYMDNKRKETRERQKLYGRRWYSGKQEEHRTIYENHHGRKLNKGECIHHIDCDPYNNEIHNLYAF